MVFASHVAFLIKESFNPHWHHLATTMSNNHGLTAITTFLLVLSQLLLSTLCHAHGNTPASLQGVAVPATPGLLDGDAPIIIDKTAAIQLGKALFWDTNVSSDGVACATCHFHAGADARTTNQLAPGHPIDKTTQLTFDTTASGGLAGPDYTLRQSDFPLYQVSDPNNKDSSVLFDSDDIVSSAGVTKTRFQNLSDDNKNEVCSPTIDSIFHANSLNTRQVQSRQAPSVINAAFNFRNFWDGRANNVFNGVSPFGVRDTEAKIWVKGKSGIATQQTLRLENASLASQAVAPPLSELEMSCRKRLFPDIGRKLLALRPLANQAVHNEDSVLAPLRNASGNGLNTSYKVLIKTVFAPRYWAGAGDFGTPTNPNSLPYTQMEANFSLFFGLALQLYQQTLISDQTPFDTARTNGFPQIPKGLNSKQRLGLKVFLNAHCAECHKGPTLSSAAHPSIYTTSTSFSSLRLINRKTINGAFEGQGVAQGIIDEGYFNTSVAPTSRDPGVGGTDPFGNPLSFSKQYLQQLLTGKPLIDPFFVNACDMDNAFAKDYTEQELISDKYMQGECGDRSVYAKIPKVNVIKGELTKPNDGRALVAVNGAFKVPTLRNIELTGPYMHNGSILTLKQVVDFYFRGGNFYNDHHFATLVFQQGMPEEDKDYLVEFLKSLTDERVRWEQAPFDHPQLFVANGHQLTPRPGHNKLAQDNLIEIPAVGKNGRTQAMGPLKAFDAYLAP